MSSEYIPEQFRELQEEAEFLCDQLDKGYRHWIEYYKDIEISGGAFAIPHRTLVLGSQFIKVYSRKDHSLLYEILRCEVGFIPLYPS